MAVVHSFPRFKPTVASRPASPAIPERTLLFGIAGGILSAALYGGWAVVSKIGTTSTIDPYDLVFLRFVVAGLVLLPVALRQPVSRLGYSGIAWPKLAVLTFLSGLPYGLLVFIGFGMAPAGHGAVLLPGSIVLFSAFLAAFVVGERVSGLRQAGLVAVLGGVLVLGGGSFAHGIPGQWVGHVLFVAAGAFWAAFTVAARIWRVPAVATTAFVTVASAAIYAPVYFCVAGFRLVDHQLLPLALQAGYQGVAVGVIAVITYTKAINILGAARASAFTALVPAIATLLATALLGEQVTVPAIFGLALVSLGMIVSVSAGTGAK